MRNTVIAALTCCLALFIAVPARAQQPAPTQHVFLSGFSFDLPDSWVERYDNDGSDRYFYAQSVMAPEAGYLHAFARTTPAPIRSREDLQDLFEHLEPGLAALPPPPGSAAGEWLAPVEWEGGWGYQALFHMEDDPSRPARLFCVMRDAVALFLVYTASGQTSQESDLLFADIVASLAREASAPPIALPTHLKRIYIAYQKVIQEGLSELKLSPISLPEGPGGVFSFALDEFAVTIPYNKIGKTSWSFQVAWPDRTDPDTPVPVMTATMLALFPKAHPQTALTAAQLLANEFADQEQCRQTVTAGEYLLLLGRGPKKSGVLFAVNKNQAGAAMTVDPSQYADITHSQAENAKNNKMKIHIRGRVVEQYPAQGDSYPQDFLLIQSDDGQYRAWFDFYSYPFRVRKDIDLDFYGVLQTDMHEQGDVTFALQGIASGE